MLGFGIFILILQALFYLPQFFYRRRLEGEDFMSHYENAGKVCPRLNSTFRRIALI
jgi:hypothetical protein